MGPMNLYFNIGLLSGFTFIAAAGWTTYWSTLIAVLTPFTVYIAYGKGKGFQYALQTFSALYSCWLLCKATSSYWPTMYFFSAFPIIHTAILLFKTENQLYHALPVFLSWTGYVFPLDLATKDFADAPATIVDVMIAIAGFLGVSFLAIHLIPLCSKVLRQERQQKKKDD